MQAWTRLYMRAVVGLGENADYFALLAIRKKWNPAHVAPDPRTSRTGFSTLTIIGGQGTRRWPNRQNPRATRPPPSVAKRLISWAPPGCGLLYGREEVLDRLWPLCVSSGWDNKESNRSARFMMIGTNNRSTIDGMIAGVRFLKELGEDAVYARMHHLARLVMKEAQRRNYLELVTADDSRFFQAMVSIRFKPDKLDALWPALKAPKINVIGGQRLRLSLHIHTRRSDIEKFFEVCDRVLAG